MNKKNLSERDICTKFITPAIVRAGWDVQTQLREEVPLTNGRVIVRGNVVNRAAPKRADYILYHKPNIPLAVVEAKDNTYTVSHGMQQALSYAEMLNVPYAFSSNGDGFVQHDRTGLGGPVEQPLSLHEFPSPQKVWERYCRWRGLDEPQEQVVTQDFYVDVSGKAPRYYQQRAINSAIEAIAKGQNRVLLVMATGTGKTFVAFQIIWRLWKAGVKKRILFLADRNILVDQTKTNDFKPFGSVMTKITRRTVDPSYEVYLVLYQAMTGPEESQKTYKGFSRDFFDLIIVDECHRGSAAEDSAWREILQYFSGATQIGLTATPKETKYVSNIDYFGKPVFIYSLRQGIDDGFLAPYKVVRIDLDKDLQGWRPEKGMVDDLGKEIEDRVYDQRDFDRIVVLNERTKRVAEKVSQLLRGTNRYDKTIVFCGDIDHADRMRQALVNENSDIAAYERRYIMRITGDNEEGKAELDNFVDPESRFPVIATTSRLMSTGVDAQTCKVIVLDRRIESLSEFKQIIGRGTRINEDYDKYYFTIMDFRKATELFADPDFDGDPVQIYEPESGDDVVPPAVNGGDEMVEPGEEETVLPPGVDPIDGGRDSRYRYKFIVSGVPVSVVAERVQYYDKDGRLITESLRDYTKSAVRRQYASLDQFLNAWTKAQRKVAIIEELRNEGLLLEALAADVGKDLDAFDLICHVAWDQPPLTRRERAQNVKRRDYFVKYGGKARAVLEALLTKYADEGLENIQSLDVLRVHPVSQIGTPVEIIAAFGGKTEYLAALRELEGELYRAA